MLCYTSFFFFKQKTAYEMRISDWSSDVCSSDLHRRQQPIRNGNPGDRKTEGNGNEERARKTRQDAQCGRQHAGELRPGAEDLDDPLQHADQRRKEKGREEEGSDLPAGRYEDKWRHATEELAQRAGQRPPAAGRRVSDLTHLVPPPSSMVASVGMA